MIIPAIAAIIGIIVALAIVITKAIVSPKKVDTVKRLLKQGKVQAAAKLAKQLIAKNPRDFHAHYYLGKAYVADNRSELALMEYKTVSGNALFDAKLPEAQFRQEFAALLMKFNHTQDALKEYLLLTRMDPKNAENFFNAGKLEEDQGHKDLALGLYRRCTQIDKRNSKAHAAIGHILFLGKQYKEAKEELDLAISLNSEEYTCYYYLGKLLKELKAYGDAIKAFEKAQRSPEFKQKALIERSTCFMMANRLDAAQIDLQRAIDFDKTGTNSDTLYARYFLAACYEKTRKIDKAIEQWELIAKRNKNFRDVVEKLDEYKDFQTNDAMKDYLTSSEPEFLELCKKAAEKGLGLSVQQAEQRKGGVKLVGVQAKNSDWRNVRKQPQLVLFFRDPEPIEDAVIRNALDEAKNLGCTNSYVINSAGFTRVAVKFAENRPVELIGKEKLETILSAKK